MDKVLALIFLLFFMIGCSSKLPTFTNSHSVPENSWDAQAYDQWLKG